MFIRIMKFNCQLSMVTYGNCVRVASIALDILFLIDLSVYILFFYWVFIIITVIIELTEFS